MGHHIITEVENEKFDFTSRSRMLVGAIFVIGLILSIIGTLQIKNNDHSTDHSAKVETVDPVQHDEHGGATDGHQADSHDAHAEEAPAHAEDHAAAAHDDHVEAGHHEEEASSWTTRLWANILMNAYYFMLFAIAALFFIAVNYAANAGWSTLVKKVAEAMTSYLPIAFITIVVVLFAANRELWDWIGFLYDGEIGDSPHDKIMKSKTWFLNKGWFFGGVPIIIAVWILFRWRLKRLSRLEDQNGGIEYFKKSVVVSAGFIVFFAFSFSMLSWLVLMSLEAEWFSTIYSVYNFAVAFVTGLTVLCMFTLYLKSKGYMSIVSDEVIHDLGKFMFAFCVFWAYIFVSQYLLIWYANLPEEVIYFDVRRTETFRPLFRTNIIMCFVLPFLILMMRNAKRNPKVLMLAGAIILLGHWVDMYLMVMPGTVGQSASIGLLEIGMTMTFAGFFIYWVLHNLSKEGLYPVNHPYLLESVNHDVGV